MLVQPPASLKALSDPIYEVFYGLTEQPFAITTDPRFFYLSASHQRAFGELLNGLRRRESLLMLTGDTGTGKTTLCRAVIDALGDRTFSAIILNPYMTGAEVLRIVLRDFGLVSHEELRRGGLATADVAQLIDTLEGFLRALVPIGSHAVLVLDEAQSLAPTVLDQIRMLTGLEYKGQKLLQVVLCGQPALQQMIQADGLLALNERITRRVALQALPPEDIPGYIQHRLGVAGGGNSVRFDAAAMQAIADLSRGLPRRINVLCDRSLQEGRIEGVHVITSALVKRAARAVAGVHEPLPVTAEPKRPAAPPAAASIGSGGAAQEPVAPTVAAAASAAMAPPAAAVQAAAQPATSQPAPRSAPPPAAPSAPAPAATHEARPAASAPPAASQPSRPDAAGPSSTSAAEGAAPPPLPRPGPVQVQPAGGVSPKPAAQPPASMPPVAAASGPGAVPVTTPPAPPQPVVSPADSPRPASSSSATTGAVAWPPPDESVTTAATSVQSEYAREFTFGLEEPRAEGRGRKVAIAAAVLAIAATAGYASWSWNVRDTSSLIGSAPPRPVADLGMEDPPPVPTAAEIDQVFQPGFIGLPPTVPALPPEPARPAPPNVAPPPTGDPFDAPIADDPAPAPRVTFPEF